MNLIKDKYRISWWDYGQEGLYFITICTKNREHFFGEINNGNMYLSEIGKIVEVEWIKTFEMRPDMNLYMDEYVVMPNHFHAVIGIGMNQYNTVNTTNTIETQCIASLQPQQSTSIPNQFGPQSKNLASVIRGFKIGVTRSARVIRVGFAWQSRFHEHIIRNSKSYMKIIRYIKNNPLNWAEDICYLSNI